MSTEYYNAAVSRSISAYIWNEVPTREIDHNLVWLDMQRQNIEQQISTLQKIKSDRERAQRWRDDLNSLAKQFCTDDGLNLELKHRIEIIRQRLGCDYARAERLANIVHSWAKNRRKDLRDENICYEHRNGVSAKKLAQKYDISRQHVYNIVKNDRNRFFIGVRS